MPLTARQFIHTIADGKSVTRERDALAPRLPPKVFERDTAPRTGTGLTFMQARLLGFIRAEAALGRTPSFDMMKDHLGLKSKSGVFRLVEALVERGFITRLHKRARSIALARPQCPHCGGAL